MMMADDEMQLRRADRDRYRELSDRTSTPDKRSERSSGSAARTLPKVALLNVTVHGIGAVDFGLMAFVQSISVAS